jgi:nucleoside-diphosphate-sugar epimerase
VLELASRGVRASVMRLPPTVHGEGDHGFVPMLINLAREKGQAAYIGEGQNRWPAVHRLDAAHLFRLALEKAPPGTRLHCVAEQGVPFKEIARVIGKQLKIPVVSKTAEEAGDHFGWFAMFAGINNPASSEKTQKQFGWSPKQPALIADLDSKAYFKI